MDFSPKFSYRDTNKRWKKENEKLVKERERNSRILGRKKMRKEKKEGWNQCVLYTKSGKREGEGRREGRKRRYEKFNLVSVGGKKEKFIFMFDLI